MAQRSAAEGETMTTTVRITYAGETVTMTWDGAQASAPILVDGDATGYQTADARHRTGAAVRLACSRVWGKVYETREDAETDGHAADSHVTIWDYVEYETLP